MTKTPANALNSTHLTGKEQADRDSTQGWRSMTPSQREIEYSPSSCIGGDYRPFVQQYKTASQEAYVEAQRLGGLWQRIDIGEVGIELCKAPLASNDLSQSLSPAPLLVFIHGGYWQELSAKDSLFAAADCIAQGISFAAVDYGLAPTFSLAQIIQQCQTALQFLVDNSTTLQIDSSRIVIAGSSAGAHLAALTGLANIQVHGLILISGIYELEPLVGTSINDALALTPQEANRLSPLLTHANASSNKPLSVPSTIVCWGENETNEFKRQSRAYAQMLQEQTVNCCTVSTFEVEKTNHFDIVFGLMNLEKTLGLASAKLF